MFKHQRKNINPQKSENASANSPTPTAVSRMGRQFFIQPVNHAQRRPRQRVLTVDCAVWGALQQTVYHHQSISSVVELKATKVSVNGVVVCSARHFCTV